MSNWIRLNRVKDEPAVILTMEAMFFLKEVGSFPGKQAGIDDEIAQLAMALATWQRALGGKGIFHEEEVVDLVKHFDILRAVAQCIGNPLVVLAYNEDDQLILAAKKQEDRA